MNILIINTFYFPNIVGGTENSIKILAENQKKKGHNIYVFTCDSPKGNIKEIVNGVVAVSYTHLDVYKRQAFLL